MHKYSKVSFVFFLAILTASVLHRSIFAIEIPTQNNNSVDQRPPNIVLIISDDQAWTDYGFTGHPTIQTPHLDRLAKQSYTFTRGYVATSLCRPSLATIITGLYPSQHGISGNDPRPQTRGGNNQSAPRKREIYLAENKKLIARMQKLETIPRLLKQKGYASFQSGKWWEGNFSVGGFDQGMTHGDPKKGGRHGDAGLQIGRKGLKSIFDFIEQRDGKPFFVWYAPFLPHTPHNPPQRLLKKYTGADTPPRLAKYYAMCEWFDETCGELIHYLDQKELGENTVVIYITDNGWIQRTPKTDVPQGWFPSFAPRSKQSPYEGGIRTPIMIRWPKKVEPKMDRATLASSIDIAPTILSIAGIDKSKHMTGIDLTKVTQGQAANRKMIWGEIFAHDMADINNPGKSLLYRYAIRDNHKVITFHAGGMQRYKALHQTQDRRPEFFDLQADPHEQKNLASNNQKKVDGIRVDLEKLAKSAQLIMQAN